ncbi:MAG TPA: polysulfide reductase NrfD [Bacteroidales bacterium]|nr:polysulfide reductase NrfD [Bacteroidales bacterium]HPS63147.1 polysulfide reductase NrfD [Bacteroidales bacterium]
MREEHIISGRMNPLVDPSLNIWHWQIPLYLFVGGVSAGILFFAALYYILGKDKETPAAVRLAPLAAPVLLVIGLGALFLDLNHKAWFWQLYMTLRIESPMSWGAWTLMVITPVSVIWCATWIKELRPGWVWRYSFLDDLEVFFIRYRSALAWIMLIFSVILGVYTGILLSAFNARPLWNTSILGPLFLASSLSTGAAVIMMVAKSHAERDLFSRIDLMMIGIELFMIVHMFMGFKASTQVQIDAANLFLGGPYTGVFFIFVVFLGLLLPAFLEILEMRGRKIPVYITSGLVLTGGIFLRFIIVYAGQASRYLY